MVAQVGWQSARPDYGTRIDKGIKRKITLDGHTLKGFIDRRRNQVTEMLSEVGGAVNMGSDLKVCERSVGGSSRSKRRSYSLPCAHTSLVA